MKQILPLVFAALAVSSATAAPMMKLEKEDRRREPIVDQATPETALAVGQLQMPEGLEAKLWAAEPMLANPVAFAFDEQGRLYVSETHRYRSSVLDVRSYMAMLERDLAARTVDDRAKLIVDLFGEEQAKEFAIESEIVRLIEDRDGDGVADFSAVYADGFDSAVDGIASGVLPRKGKVYFTNIPHLWELEGMTEDGRATSRKSLQYGFGVHFGYTGHDFHGLAMGPDGKLYFSIGDRGVSLITQEGNRIDYQDTGAVFRSNLDGSELEIVHHGLRNPQELVFDELGNLFTGDNDCDNGDFERLVQIVEGGDSGWRVGHQYAFLNPGGVWMSEGWWKMEFEGRALFALPPISYIEDGPSGVAYYPGTGLAPDYQGHIWICHFKGSVARSGIQTYTIAPKGASFQLKESKPFLRGILPTDVTFAPDGKLYVADWVDGWPKSQKGRVYAISHPDHADSDINKRTEQLIAEGMEKRPEAELDALLDHPNWNVRLEAQFELAARGDKNVRRLAQVANDEARPLFARLHAAWGLGQLADAGSKPAAKQIRALLRSGEAEIRAQAAKLAGDHAISAAYKDVLALLKDDSSRARFFAAQSLGKFGKPDAAAALLQAARENGDQDAHLRHAIVMGLVGSGNAAALEEAASDSSRAVRAAVLLAYRRLGDANIARFLDDPDPLLVLEAARAINDEPIPGAFAALAAKAESPLAADPALGQRALNARFRHGADADAQALAQYAARDESPQALRIEAINYLASWPEPHDRDRVLGVYRPLDDRDAAPAAKALADVTDALFATAPGAVQAEAIRAMTKLGVATNADQLYAFVTDETRDGAARAAAFDALDHLEDPRMDDLVAIASRSNASQLRIATLPLVAERSPAEAEATLSLMVQGNVEEQRAAFDVLGKTTQPFAERLLAESVQRLSKDGVLPGAQLELLESAAASKAPLVEASLAAYQTEVAADPDPVAAFGFALAGGSARSGGGAFFGNKVMACVRCHIIDGPGENAGPNLSDIGLKRDARHLLESIVAPNAHISPGFENAIVTLKSGETKIGIVAAETDETLSLALADQTSVAIAKTDIAKRESMPSSMPNIFGTLLSRKELRDLVAFLQDRTTDPNARTSHGE